ncbi:MAG: ATP-binding cassette domain-containing protein [Parachlamydia sp.]|nr:ATP-binding cassette domain-containing protein [Parachlamydia sp.]
MYPLIVEDLAFSFDGHAPLFQQLTFKLERGRIHRLKGKNGSGKSTLFGILQGDIPIGAILSGTLKINGKDHHLSEGTDLKGSIACVTQRFDSMLSDQLSFEDNLRSALLPAFPLPWKPLPKAQPLPPFLNRFEIDLKKPVYLLSGGQRQILSLLMILQRQPALLLLDEPTAALDAVNARLVFEFLREMVLQLNVTALVISHDEELACSYCDGIIVNLLTK